MKMEGRRTKTVSAHLYKVASISIMTARHGLLFSPLLIYFLISSSTLCRQTELNTYGNIVGRRGLEFSRGFAQYIQERSVISIYSLLTRHALEVFAIQMSYGLASPVEICLVNGHPL